MNRHGRVLLAATLLGGCIGITLVQTLMVTPQAVRSVSSSATAPHSLSFASGASSYILTAAIPGPSLATTAAVLAQQAKGRWQTTVILSQATGAECPGPGSDYWLETTNPDQAYPASTVIRVGHGPCRVTVTFNAALTATPESALLVLDEGGDLSSTQLSLSRYIGKLEYYGVSAIFGALMALALVALIGSMRVYGDDGSRIYFYKRTFWQQTIPVLQADVLKVSGISVATVLGTLIGAAALANSLFPGVAISNFVILSIIYGMIVAAGPGVYRLLYRGWVSRHPVDVGKTALELNPDSAQKAIIEVPSGAEIKVPAHTVVVDKAGTRIAVSDPLIGIPADSEIEIVSGKSLKIPADSNLLLKGKCSVEIRNDGGELVFGNTRVRLPVTIEAATDTTITYKGQQACIRIPADANLFRGSRRVRVSAPSQRFTLTPDGNREPSASMMVIVGPALCTVFGIGAELGLLGVLAVILSDGGTVTRVIAGLLIAAVAVITLYYSFNTISTAADAS